MNRRTKLQLRLQQTVESLSVVAISYYANGLLAYMVRGFHPSGSTIPVEQIVALLVPAVLFIVVFALRRLCSGGDVE